MAGNADESRRHAKDCLRLASKIQNEQSRRILLKLAETWQDIAEKEEAAWPVQSLENRQGETNLRRG